MVFILVVMEEAQGAVGTHRRDPSQTILIGGGKQEGRRGKQETSSEDPRGWASDDSWKFLRSVRELVKAFDQGSTML